MLHWPWKNGLVILILPIQQTTWIGDRLFKHCQFIYKKSIPWFMFPWQCKEMTQDLDVWIRRTKMVVDETQQKAEACINKVGVALNWASTRSTWIRGQSFIKRGLAISVCQSFWFFWLLIHGAKGQTEKLLKSALNKTSLVPGALLFRAASRSFSLSHHWISETLRPGFSSGIQSPRGAPAALCLFGSRLPLRPHGEDSATDTRSSPSFSLYTSTTHIRLWASLAWLHPLWLPACESEWGADGESLSRLWLPWACSGISTCPLRAINGKLDECTCLCTDSRDEFVCLREEQEGLNTLPPGRLPWMVRPSQVVWINGVRVAEC